MSILNEATLEMITNILNGETPVAEAEHATSADSADSATSAAEATHAASADSADKITNNTLSNALHLPKIYVNEIAKRPAGDGEANTADYLTIMSTTWFNSSIHLPKLFVNEIAMRPSSDGADYAGSNLTITSNTVFQSSVTVNTSLTANMITGKYSVTTSNLKVDRIDAQSQTSGAKIYFSASLAPYPESPGVDIEGFDTVDCNHVTIKEGYIINDIDTDSDNVYTLTLPKKTGTLATLADIPETPTPKYMYTGYVYNISLKIYLSVILISSVNSNLDAILSDAYNTGNNVIFDYSSGTYNGQQVLTASTGNGSDPDFNDYIGVNYVTSDGDISNSQFNGYKLTAVQTSMVVL